MNCGVFYKASGLNPSKMPWKEKHTHIWGPILDKRRLRRHENQVNCMSLDCPRIKELWKIFRGQTWESRVWTSH